MIISLILLLVLIGTASAACEPGEIDCGGGCYPLGTGCCDMCDGSEQPYFSGQKCTNGLICNIDERACGDKCIPNQATVNGIQVGVSCCLSVYENDCTKSVDYYVHASGERCCSKKTKYNINNQVCCTNQFLDFLGDDEFFIANGAAANTAQKRSICEDQYEPPPCEIPDESCCEEIIQRIGGDRFSEFGIDLDGSDPDTIKYLRCINFLERGNNSVPDFDLGNYSFTLKGNKLSYDKGTLDISEYTGGETIKVTDKGYNIIGNGFDFVAGLPDEDHHIVRTGEKDFKIEKRWFGEITPLLHFKNINGRVDYDLIQKSIFDEDGTYYRVGTEGNTEPVTVEDGNIKHVIGNNGYVEKNLDDEGIRDDDFFKLKEVETTFTSGDDFVKITSEGDEKKILINRGSHFKTSGNPLDINDPLKVEIDDTYDAGVDLDDLSITINGKPDQEGVTVETDKTRIESTNGLKMTFFAKDNTGFVMRYDGMPRGELGTFESKITLTRNGEVEHHWLPFDIKKGFRRTSAFPDKEWVNDIKGLVNQGYEVQGDIPSFLYDLSLNKMLEVQRELTEDVSKIIPKLDIDYENDKITISEFEGPLAEGLADVAFQLLKLSNSDLIQDFKKFESVEAAEAAYLEKGYTQDEINAIKIYAEASPTLHDNPGIVRYLINQERLDPNGIKINKVEYVYEEGNKKIEIDLDNVRIKAVLDKGPRPVKGITKGAGMILKAPFEAGEFIFSKGEKVPIIKYPAKLLKQIFRQPNTAIKHLSTGANYDFHLVTSVTKDENGDTHTVNKVDFSRK